MDRYVGKHDRHSGERYPLFWVRSDNFGDALNEFLYRQITGRDPVHSRLLPKILAIGSVMHMAAPGDVVWGAGCISENHPVLCDRTTRIRMVRGPLTRDILLRVGADVLEVYGCPALLLPNFIKPSQVKKHEIGYIPHYTDVNVKVDLPDHAVLIHPMTGSSDESINRFINLVTSCEYVVSSSLHGIVAAESYGIPAVWLIMGGNVEGHGFKFRDYYLGTGREPPTPRRWHDEQRWDDVPGIAEEWIAPRYDADAILDLCPFDLKIPQIEERTVDDD